MDSERRQAGLAALLSVLAGLGFVVWTFSSPPADTSRPTAAPAPAAADTAGPARDTRFEPAIGQAGKDVVWVPTSHLLVESMLTLADVTARDYVIDLGSGDGRTVIAAAKRGATAVGIEYNPDMVALSRKNAEAAGVGAKARFVRGDFFKTDLSKATVITMFLLPRLNLQLRPRLLDLEPGTRVVSNSFDMGDWVPDRAERVVTKDCSHWCMALLWIVPGRVAGTWNLPDGALELTQKFQAVSGTLAGQPLTPVTLVGRRLSFTAGGTDYDARVEGDAMTGTGGSDGSWTAHLSNLQRPSARGAEFSAAP